MSMSWSANHLKTAFGVEHHAAAIDIVGKTFGCPAPGRDFDGFADAIERGFYV
jgi:hypothetical protein